MIVGSRRQVVEVGAFEGIGHLAPLLFGHGEAPTADDQAHLEP
jgi:hypothetical protein